MQSQLHAGAQPQRHLSCGVAALVPMPGDLTNRQGPDSQQLRALQVVTALLRSVRNEDSHQTECARTPAAAAHNTAQLAVAASIASGESSIATQCLHTKGMQPVSDGVNPSVCCTSYVGLQLL